MLRHGPEASKSKLPRVIVALLLRQPFCIQGLEAGIVALPTATVASPLLDEKTHQNLQSLREHLHITTWQSEGGLILAHQSAPKPVSIDRFGGIGQKVEADFSEQLGEG